MYEPFQETLTEKPNLTLKWYKVKQKKKIKEKVVSAQNKYELYTINLSYHIT